jgi:hypothetical protein
MYRPITCHTGPMVRKDTGGHEARYLYINLRSMYEPVMQHLKLKLIDPGLN